MCKDRLKNIGVCDNSEQYGGAVVEPQCKDNKAVTRMRIYHNLDGALTLVNKLEVCEICELTVTKDARDKGRLIMFEPLHNPELCDKDKQLPDNHGACSRSITVDEPLDMIDVNEANYGKLQAENDKLKAKNDRAADLIHGYLQLQDTYDESGKPYLGCVRCPAFPGCDHPPSDMGQCRMYISSAL